MPYEYQTYWHISYGQATLTSSQADTLRKAGVLFASKTTPASAPDLAIYHLGVPASLKTGCLPSPDAQASLQSLMARGALLAHPGYASNDARQIGDLSGDRLELELAYEQARAKWIANSLPSDHQSDVDRQDYLVLQEHSSRIPESVRVSQIQRHRADLAKVAASPYCHDLQLTWRAPGTVLQKVLVDARGFTWGAADCLDKALDLAERRRIGAKEPWQQTQAEFERLALQLHPSQGNCCFADEPSLLMARQLLAHYYDCLSHNEDAATRPTRPRAQWIEQSLAALYPKSRHPTYYLSGDQRNTETDLSLGLGAHIFVVPPGRSVDLQATHKNIVATALDRGENVPCDVTRDYPDLLSSAARQRQS